MPVAPALRSGGRPVMPETLATLPTQKQSLYQKYGINRLLPGLSFMTFWSVLLFACAGTFHWMRGWICAGSYAVIMLGVGMAIARLNPGLFAARAKWRRSDTKGFDKIILPIYFSLSISLPAIAGLDAVRFRWSSMAFWTIYLGFLLFAVAMLFMTWVMAVNPWAESTVRIQTDRGQQVVEAGPYRIVRHPMYIAMALIYPSAALILGSWWALAVSGLMAALVVIRTALEDRTLRRELPGYEQYTKVTRWRLAPGIW